MFKKNGDRQGATEPNAQDTAPTFEVRKRSASVIGPTLRFKGELWANEDLIIEGEIEGKIAHQDKNLTVGKNGRVKADIHAQMVEVLGKVVGDIRGDDVVRLAKTASVTGNIHCARIVMEDGAYFDGSIHMEQPQPQARSADKAPEPNSKASLTVADGADLVSRAGG